MSEASNQSKRVVVVTGAGGALGTAITARFAAAPDTALVISDVSPDALDATVSAVGSPAGPVEAVLADVSDAAQVRAVVDRAVDQFDRLDVYIGNAGVLAPNGRIHNQTEADWQRAFAVNVLGSANGISAAVEPMRRQGSGAIVLTASVAGLTAWSHAAPYCATKAAVIQLVKVAAVEYARDGIRVNCVCPGTFLSAIHDDLPQEALDAMAARHPMGLGQAADVAGAFEYLASDGAGWTTGTALVVDGGYAAP